MSKKLTNFFISSKENNSVSRKLETVATIPAYDDIANFFHPPYIFSFPKTKIGKKY